MCINSCLNDLWEQREYSSDNGKRMKVTQDRVHWRNLMYAVLTFQGLASEMLLGSCSTYYGHDLYIHINFRLFNTVTFVAETNDEFQNVP
jgi:hypothetical protein